MKDVSRWKMTLILLATLLVGLTLTGTLPQILESFAVIGEDKMDYFTAIKLFAGNILVVLSTLGLSSIWRRRK